MNTKVTRYYFYDHFFTAVYLLIFKCNQKGQPGDNKNEVMARGQRTQTF